MSYSTKLTKENLDYYLRELAKEFRRLNGKTMPAEMILIGGASVLINYGFRDMTSDVDAIISASSVMKEAINKVGDLAPQKWASYNVRKKRKTTSKGAERKWRERTTQSSRSLLNYGK